MSSNNCCSSTATSSVDACHLPLTDPLSFVDSRTTKHLMPKIQEKNHSSSSSASSEKCTSCHDTQYSAHQEFTKLENCKMNSKCDCRHYFKKFLTKLQRFHKSSKNYQKNFSLALLLFVFSSLYYTSDARPSPRYSPGRQLILQTSNHHRLYNPNHHHQRTHYLQQKQQQEKHKLLHQQITEAFPTTRRHHHLSHRSAPTLPPNPTENMNCPDFESPLRQAETTVNIIRNKLNIYTSNQFNTDDPLKLSEEWKATPLSFKHYFLDIIREKEEHQRLKNIDKKLDVEAIKQKILKNRPLTPEVLKDLMVEVYITLWRFNKGLETVIKLRKENEPRLLNDLANDQDKLNAITAFLEDVQREIKFNLNEANATLTHLKVMEPKDIDMKWNYDEPDKVQEWKLIEAQIVTIKLLAEIYAEMMCNSEKTIPLS